MLMQKLAPALAVGCTCVVKPSEFAAGSVFEMVKILAEAGIPPGVINVITGEGPVVVQDSLIIL